jgi:hypothetical protein
LFGDVLLRRHFVKEMFVYAPYNPGYSRVMGNAQSSILHSADIAQSWIQPGPGYSPVLGTAQYWVLNSPGAAHCRLFITNISATYNCILS